MAAAEKKPKSRKRKVEAYDHKGKKRANNPPVGLVTPKTDPDEGKKRRYAYDSHLDPQLTWAGKAERTSFEIPTVSLHVHERIEPRTILEAVRKRNGNGAAAQGLGIHSYLSYLRDRLLLAKELLTESGSCFVQISDENLHLVRDLMDEVFGVQNSVVILAVQKTGSQTGSFVQANCDYLIWYAKSRPHAEAKFRRLFLQRRLRSAGGTGYSMVELPDGNDRALTEAEIADLRLLPEGSRVWRAYPLTSEGFRPTTTVEFRFGGKAYYPGKNRHWGVTIEELDKVGKKSRLVALDDQVHLKRYFDDFPVIPLGSYWDDVGGASNRVFVVQTNPLVIQRCLLMTTDPGDLVFDPTCGSGTTAFVAEQWGRRWITCDTSRVAVAIARQRLMTALYDYYELAHPEEGVGSGFRYKTVPHVTLKSIANNEPPAQETLYDQPFVDKGRARVTGPFTVEAVPAPAVKPLSVVESAPHPSPLPGGEGVRDASIGRSGATVRHAEWRGELLRTGVRGKGGQMIQFSRVEPLGGTRWLHADAETRPAERGAGGADDRAPYGKPERVVVSFGPEHAPLEQKQVEMAWEEARTLDPRPAILLFASFQFDPEAAKDIEELTKEKMGMTFLKVQMNTDLLTEDLKKKRASNQSFWLIGQPDVELRPRKDGKLEVEVRGFDYYNPKTGEIESGDVSKIALWMLDPDYDGRSVYPRQFFFPMAGEGDGWARLARNLNAEIDPDLIEKYRGAVSLPFEPGDHRRVAVKIVDDRGIESLKVVEIA